MNLRIIVADHQSWFREDMIRALKLFFPAAILEEADTLEQVMVLARSGVGVDILILELCCPDTQSLQIIQRIRYELKHTHIIVLSMLNDLDLICQIIALGANGFLGKSLGASGIAGELVAIREGDVVVKFHVDSSIVEDWKADTVSMLTARQKKSIGLVRSGGSNTKTAEELRVSHFPLSLHVLSLLNVLGAQGGATDGAQRHRFGLGDRKLKKQ